MNPATLFANEKTGKLLVKGLLVIGGGVLAFVIGKKIVKAIKERRADNATRKAQEDVQKQIRKQDPQAQTLTDVAAQNIARDMLEAFDYWGGTDFTTLSNCRDQIRNCYGWAQVRAAFGKPKYGWTGSAWVGGEALNLIGWVRREISDGHELYKQFVAWDNEANRLGLKDGVAGLGLTASSAG